MGTRTTERLSDFFRLGGGQGAPHASTDYTLSSGFGSTASVTLTRCNDMGGRVRIAATGTGFGANPTCTIAYKDGPWDNAPHVYTTRGGGSQATISMSVTSEWTTGCEITFNGTATGAETYTFNYVVQGS
jgi:hypothetical protein